MVRIFYYRAPKKLFDDLDKEMAKKIAEDLRSNPKMDIWGTGDWGSMYDDYLFLVQTNDRQQRTLISRSPLSRKMVEQVLKGEKHIYVYNGSHYWFMRLNELKYITSNCEYICNELFKRVHKTIVQNIRNKVNNLVKKDSSQLKELHTGYTKIIDEINKIVINNKFEE
jgi:hypothetical protein